MKEEKHWKNVKYVRNRWQRTACFFWFTQVETKVNSYFPAWISAIFVLRTNKTGSGRVSTEVFRGQLVAHIAEVR